VLVGASTSLSLARITVTQTSIKPSNVLLSKLTFDSRTGLQGAAIEASKVAALALNVCSSAE
jgi:hypothetical protein